MLGRLLLLFIVVPIIELALLVQLGRIVGLLPTLTLVFGTGFLGALLTRAQGLRTVTELRRELAAGRVPGRQILDGLSILVGGAFLLTPGLLTDAAGLALLFPASRGWLQARLRRWLERQIELGTMRVSVLRWEPGTSSPRRDVHPRLDPSKEIRVPEPDKDR